MANRRVTPLAAAQMSDGAQDLETISLLEHTMYPPLPPCKRHAPPPKNSQEEEEKDEGNQEPQDADLTSLFPDKRNLEPPAAMSDVPPQKKAQEKEVEEKDEGKQNPEPPAAGSDEPPPKKAKGLQGRSGAES